MSKLSIIREFWSFLKVRKKWWLAPIVAFLLMLGVLWSPPKVQRWRLHLQPVLTPAQPGAHTRRRWTEPLGSGVHL